MTTETVIADPQFSLVKILRPFAGFEAVYAGQGIGKPLMLTQVIKGTGGQAVDPLAQANEPGYDPQLIRGIKVPMGARVLLQVPNFVATTGGGSERYSWIVMWRFRNVRDHRLNPDRPPYHFPKQGEGATDTDDPLDLKPRVIVPAAYQTTIYIQPEPTTVNGIVTQNGRREDVSFGADDPELPLLPDGTDGHYQQGVQDPAVAGTGAFKPGFMIYETTAPADELCLGITRTTALDANWNFTQPSQGTPGADSELSRQLGNGNGVTTALRDLGVFMTTGIAP